MNTMAKREPRFFRDRPDAEADKLADEILEKRLQEYHARKEAEPRRREENIQIIKYLDRSPGEGHKRHLPAEFLKELRELC